MDEPVRRRRRAGSEAAPEAETAPVTTEQPGRRRKRTSVGGLNQKLNAPPREGFVRRWVNDIGDRLAQTRELAYEFVSEKGIKTDDPSSRIARRVGTGAGGEPIMAYLVETPEEEFSYGESDKETARRQVEEQIASGQDPSGELLKGDAREYAKGSIRVER